MLSLKDRLKEILINNKLITQEQLDKAIQTQKEKGGRLSDIIVGLNFIKENELILSLSQGLGLPPIDLKRFSIDLEVAKIIPYEIARHYQIIAVSKMGDTITLAMADPLNIFAIDHVKALTGYKINPIISSSQDIIQTIDLSYPDAAEGVVEGIVREMTSSVELVKKPEEALPDTQELDRISHEAPVIQITNRILEEAVLKKASDILIEPCDKKLRMRFRIDGVLQEQKPPPKGMHASIISRIKVISNLNIAERRLPQDGRFKAQIADRDIDFRVSILPSSLGEKAALRILDKSQATLDIEKLGFSEEAILKLKGASTLPHGLILVCGPTGSGKTTTLYSILKFVDSPEKNLVTVEDPIEFQLEGINQVASHPEIGLTFACALRSILRQDPNVIMIGEIRDFETVDIAIKSALTGHLVISTLHTTTAPGAIVRLINMGVEPYLINASLICVVSQRLVRKVCSYCKQKYVLKKDILDSLRLVDINMKDKDFYRGKGCPHCFNTGYSGRIAIAEILLMTQKIRELVLSGAQEHLIKQQACQEGMMTLRQAGLQAAANSLTSLEEVLRLTAADE
jgi:type IV pilus assembly protein PilB